MTYSRRQLRRIYDRTSGYCHLCHRKLAFTNYGEYGAKGAWEVEHSNARVRGGSNQLNNLYAAHVTCNRSKQDLSTRTARASNGKSRAPLSKSARKRAKIGNSIAGGLLGYGLGAAIHPALRILGAIVGAGLGHSRNPDR